MNFTKSLLSRALLAAALVSGAGTAVAGPVAVQSYHVDINTTAFTGLSGYIDLSFLPGVESGPATATVSHFSGNFGSYADMSAPGLSVTSDGKLVFDNTQYADLFASINLGGSFSFDVSFDGPATGIGGTDFDVSVFGADLNYLLPSVVHFTLQPGSVTPSVDENYATIGPVAAVPEPSAAALVLIGLMMAGAVARRRA